MKKKTDSHRSFELKIIGHPYGVSVNLMVSTRDTDNYYIFLDCIIR